MQINVIEYLEKGVPRLCPGKVAIVDEDRSYTFAELKRNSKCCASMIINHLDVINQPICIFLPKCAEMIFADLGVIYSGNIYSNLDVNSPPRRFQTIVSTIGPKLIITSRKLLDKVVSLGIPPDMILTIDDVYQPDLANDNNLIFHRLGSVIDTDPLCIINTSGSTGIPKGVVMNHRSVIDFMDWVMERLDLNGSEIIGSLSPFYFDIYTLELYLSLAKGSTIVILPESLSGFPARLLEFMVTQKVNFIFWVPTVMVNIANMDLLAKIDLSCLKKLFYAGEVFPTKHVNYWRRHLPHTMIVNLYGPIEITVDCTYFVLDREFRDDEPIPIGFPCRNTDVLILNEKDENAKTNEPGELCVRGSSLAMGYWNNLDRTSKAFVQNPLNKSYPEIIYRTGDLAYRNDRGEIMFLGRRDFQIKHLGYRIELGEIENGVLSLQEINNACVLYNTEKKCITLFFEAAEELSPAFIRTQLSSIIPKYMLPTVFHQMSNLPRNSNGKIDRHKLSLTLA